MKKIIALALLSALVFGCATQKETSLMENTQTTNVKKKLSKKFKSDKNANPISDCFFCADPTAVEYEGRLYVYGTNDHQQYENAEKNTYEKIKSLLIFSTDDMVNWRYEGQIETGKIAPWIVASWAPSICKRVEDDGLTHFYLYFSNSGCGVGVLTATNPTGPWTSPLNRGLIYQNMPGLKDCPAPFDPGVCIDDNGVGWLAFGGGDAKTPEMPGTVRLVRLGKDMISLDSDFIELKAPYFFEASEMNFINGTYVYTFNTSWVERNIWNYAGVEKFSTCSMCYMTTKTPLDSDSWVLRGEYFPNPGNFGMDYSNNHTHLEKFNGKYYLFYHAMILQKFFGTNGGFRSLCVDEIEVDEENVVIKKRNGTRAGTSAIKNHDAFELTPAATIFNSREISFERIGEGRTTGNMAVKAKCDGAWFQVKNVDFDGSGKVPTPVGLAGTDVGGANGISYTGNVGRTAESETDTVSGASGMKILANVKGSGTISVLIDLLDGEAVAVIDSDGADFKEVAAELSGKISGVHNLYFVLTGDVVFDWWKFVEK